MNIENFPYAREEQEKRLMWAFKQVMTEEQYVECERIIKGMTDAQILKLSMDSLHEMYIHPECQTDKWRLNAQKQLAKSAGVTSKNSAMRSEKISFLNKEENINLLRKINNSYVTDIVELTEEEDNEIQNLWNGDFKKDIAIPSDLLFSETLPLHDVRISIDERKNGGEVVKYRVLIFQNYSEILKSQKEEVVGYLILENFGGKEIFMEICACYGVDFIAINCKRIGYKGYAEQELSFLQNKLKCGDFQDFVFSFLSTWYGIQIALLHPKVKEVFQKPQRIPINKSQKKECERKCIKIKYIKKHVIKNKELKELIHGKNGNYSRHALIWYVTGHWRTYRNGNKVFIQPYFKGALRETKKLQSEREREIILDNDKGIGDSKCQ